MGYRERKIKRNACTQRKKEKEEEQEGQSERGREGERDHNPPTHSAVSIREGARQR